MKYYQLFPNINIQEIGKYPQSVKCQKYGDIYKISQIKGELGLFVLPEPIIQSKARLTTFLHSIPVGHSRILILRNDLLNFIEKFDVEKNESWNIKVHHKKKILYDYALFHVSNPSQQKYIDYTNSKFYIGKRKDRNYKGKAINVKNDENFISTFKILFNEGLKLKCDCLILDLRSATEDLFRLTSVPFGHGYYVSERLKNAIEKERFTGLAFKEIEEYNKKIKVIY